MSALALLLLILEAKGRSVRLVLVQGGRREGVRGRLVVLVWMPGRRREGTRVVCRETENVGGFFQVKKHSYSSLEQHTITLTSVAVNFDIVLKKRGVATHSCIIRS